MILRADATPISALERSPESAYRQGMAAVDLDTFDHQSVMWTVQTAQFAEHLDETIERTLDGSLQPRRLEPVDPKDIRRMEYLGMQFGRMVLPITRVAPREIIRARFLVYDAIGSSTDEHIDDPLEDDHEFSVGVDLVGEGILRTPTYARPSELGYSTRTPVLLTPNSAVVQRGQSQITHSVESLDERRIFAIWDFAA